MAYIADFSTKASATRVANLDFAAVDFPAHVADNYLVIGASVEADGTTLSLAVSGWTQIGSTVGLSTTATGLYSAMWYLKCTGSAHTASIVITGATAAIHAHAFLIVDADLTTFLDGTPSAANVATASSFSSATITTSAVDALILFYIGVDSTTTTPTACHSDPGPIHFLDSSDNGGANTTASTKVMAGAACGWYIQRTAGATPTPSWRTSLTATTNRFTVGIKNKTGGRIPAYVDDVLSLGTQMMQGNRVTTASLNGESFPSTLTLQRVDVSTIAATYDAGAVVADMGLNPYSAAVNSTPSASATAGLGFQVVHTAIDMTAGWIVGAFKCSTSKMANYSQGGIAKGGTFLVVGSGTTTNDYYRSFKVMARDNADGNGVGFTYFSVMPNQTSTQYAQNTNPPAISNMTRFGLFHMGMVETGALYYPEVQFIKQVVVAGGDATNPVDAAGMYQAGRSSRMELIKKAGAAELTAYVPIQIGGGDAVNLKLVAGALQFPRIYSTTDKEINYHGSSGAIGISLSGKSGDTIYMGDGYVITSASPYYFNINANATNAATWYLKGLVLVRANVTLRNVMTFTGITFSSCGSLDFSSCTVTDCKVTAVPAASASLTLNSSSALSSCTFDVSTVTAGNHFVTMADPSKFTNCSFTGGGGHAIRITTPGTYTFTGNTFTGFGADGSTGAAIINDSGGGVTINIAGGGSTPTYKNGTGTSTTINNSYTLTLTGLVVGSDVTITTSDTNTVVGSVDQNGTTSWGYVYTTAQTVDVKIVKAGYIVYMLYDLALATASSSIPISQDIDRTYQ